MDRRGTPNTGKRHNSPKPRSPPSADYLANFHNPDEAYKLSCDVILGCGGGLMHNSTVTSVAASRNQFDSKSVAWDLNGRDCNMYNVKNLTVDVGDLKLTHDSAAEIDSSEVLEPFNTNIGKVSGSPPAWLHANDKSLNVLGAQRKQTGYAAKESYLPHVNTSCIEDSARIGESSRTTDFCIKDMLLKGGIECGKNSQEKTGFDEESGNSHYRYDICPPRTRPTVRLKAPLHVKNREIRNETKRRMEGCNNLILRPGMILLKGYISFNDQVKLIKTCRELGLGSGGFYQPGYCDGAKLNLKMMCLGKNWDPVASAYGDKRPSDGAKPPLIPDEFSQLVKKAIKDSHDHLREGRRKRNVEDILPPMSPNICIVNFYTKSGQLGLHQDKDETQESLRKGLPVVSFSIGDSADFVYGDQRDILNVEKVRLESGDVLIFGGQARHIYHGVTTIYSDTAPHALLEETNLRSGRLNLTFREY